MSLNDGYDLVEKAERCVAKRQYTDASALYKDASILFTKKIGSIDNDEANRALQVLADENMRRGNELSLLQNQKLTPKSSRSSIYSPLPLSKQPSADNISVSLASARGVSAPNTNIDNFVNEETTDPITKFQVQVHNLIKPPTLNTDIDISQSARNVKLSGKSIEELELENRTLKQLLSTYSENLQGYESFHKKLKVNLKNYLNTLRADLQAQDRQRKAVQEKKLEAMDKENKRLESQIKKLKERWNELVESAKRRREDNQEKKEDK